MLELNSLNASQEEETMSDGVRFADGFKRKALEVAKELGQDQVVLVENGFFVSRLKGVDGYRAIGVVDFEEGGRVYVLQRQS